MVPAHVHDHAAARADTGAVMAQERRRHAAGGDLEGFEEIGVHEKKEADGRDEGCDEAA